MRRSRSHTSRPLSTASKSSGWRTRASTSWIPSTAPSLPRHVLVLPAGPGIAGLCGERLSAPQRRAIHGTCRYRQRTVFTPQINTDNVEGDTPQACFTPEGLHVISGCEDNTLKMWRLPETPSAAPQVSAASSNPPCFVDCLCDLRHPLAPRCALLMAFNAPCPSQLSRLFSSCPVVLGSSHAVGAGIPRTRGQASPGGLLDPAARHGVGVPRRRAVDLRALLVTR